MATNEIGTATGSNAYTQSLGIAIQMAIFFLTAQSITNEQSAALATLLFPWVHWLMLKAGDKDGDGIPDVIKPPVKTGAAAALVALCFLALGSCSSTPRSDIAALEVGLTATETAALAYVRLLRCPQQTPLCSDDDIVSRISDYRKEAVTAVLAARDLVWVSTTSSSDSMKAILTAQIAVAAFRDIVSQLPR